MNFQPVAEFVVIVVLKIALKMKYRKKNQHIHWGDEMFYVFEVLFLFIFVDS